VFIDRSIGLNTPSPDAALDIFNKRADMKVLHLRGEDLQADDYITIDNFDGNNIFAIQNDGAMELNVQYITDPNLIIFRNPSQTNLIEGYEDILGTFDTVTQSGNINYGGLRMRGFNSSASVIGVQFIGVSKGEFTRPPTTYSNGVVEIYAARNAAPLSARWDNPYASLVTMFDGGDTSAEDETPGGGNANYRQARFHFMSNGDLYHYSGILPPVKDDTLTAQPKQITLTNTALDDYDDLKLLRTFESMVDPNVDHILDGFRDMVEENKESLVKERLISINPDETVMVNLSRMNMLFAGAIRQMHNQFNHEISALKNILIDLGVSESKIQEAMAV
jgi:hypothetical protein